MTDLELAEALRPVMLFGEDEYILAEPDVALAAKFRSTRTELPPSTNPYEGPSPTLLSAQPTSPAYRFQTIFGSNDRYQTYNTTTYPARANFTFQSGCSGAIIGRYVGLSSAHCFYDMPSHTWLSRGAAIPGAGGQQAGPYNPYGNQGYAIVIPTAFTWGLAGTQSHEWAYDYAVVNFQAAIGDTVGWLGVAARNSGEITAHAYPQDYLGPAGFKQVYHYNGVITNGFTWWDNVFHNHDLDLIQGASGGCIMANIPNTCIGIHSASNASTNRSRHWSSETYAFFDAYGTSWP